MAKEVAEALADDDTDVGLDAIRRYQVRLTLTTPILFHQDDIDWADRLEAWRADPANKKFSKAGDDRSPAWRWIGHVPTDGQQICVPAEYVMSCFKDAGAMVPVPGGKSGKTFKSQSQSGMMVEQPFIPLLLGGKPIPMKPIHDLMKEKDFAKHEATIARMGMSLMKKRARIGTAKHIRVRLRIDEGDLVFRLSVIDEQLTLDVLQNIVTAAGRYKGLGDWRPGGKTPGQFGMFSGVVTPLD